MQSIPPNLGTSSRPVSPKSPDPPGCWSAERLRLYLDGTLSAVEEREAETHVETCVRCSRILNRLSNPQLRDLPQLPEFEFDGVIGHGGMGTIYRAHDLLLHRDVAVKVLKTTLANDADLRERFITEARISSRLDHANILPVHDLKAFPDGRLCLVMKLVRGKTLADLLARRQWDDGEQAQLLDYFEQACKAVTYAHALGVIHRDLKPSNIMVEEVATGAPDVHIDVFVMDWGLAKEIHSVRSGEVIRRDETDKPETDEVAHGLTRHGLGTVPYMPPEQARGEPDLDERVDVFSLGAILCEILTGFPPYASGEEKTSGFNRTFSAAEQADLEPAYYRLAVCEADQDLIDLAVECLQADRKRRPRNAGAIARRLIEYRARIRDLPNLATLGLASDLATNRQMETKFQTEVAARTRAEQTTREEQVARAEAERRAREDQASRSVAEATAYMATEARADAEKHARRERAARERAAKARQRAVLVASAITGVLLVLVGVLYWLYRERTMRADRAVQQELAAASQLLAEVPDATPENILTLIQKARERVEIAQQLARSIYASDQVKANLTTIDAASKAANDAALRDQRLLSDLFVARHADFLSVQDKLTDERLIVTMLANDGSAGSAFVAAWRRWGIDIVDQPPGEVVERIKSRPRAVVRAIIVALDAQAIAALQRERRGVVAKSGDMPPVQLIRRLGEIANRLDERRDTARMRNALKENPKDGIQRSIPPITDPETTLILYAQLAVAAPELFGRNAADPDFGPTRVLEMLRQAAMARPSSSLLLEAQAELYLRQSPPQYEKALDALRAARLVNPWLEMPLAWVLVTANRGGEDNVIRSFRDALAHEESAPLQNALGVAYHRLGQLADADAAFRKAIDLAPTFSDAHNNLGVFQLDRNDVAGAIASFQHTVKLRPKSAVAYCNLGVALVRRGDKSAAAAAFETASKLNLQFATPYYHLGLLIENGTLAGDARAKFQEAINYKPDYAAAYFRLGTILLGRKKLTDAAAAFQKAVQSDDHFAEAYASLGGVLYQQGHYREALTTYQKAFRLDRSHSGKTYTTAARAAAHARDSDVARSLLIQSLAREWLVEAVARYQRQVQVRDPELTTGQIRDIRLDLDQLRSDAALTQLCGEGPTPALPEADRRAWKELWANLNDLLKSLPQ